MKIFTSHNKVEKSIKPALENLEGRLVPATLIWDFKSSGYVSLQVDLPEAQNNTLAVSSVNTYGDLTSVKTLNDVQVIHKLGQKQVVNSNVITVDGNPANNFPVYKDYFFSDLKVVGSSFDDTIDLSQWNTSRPLVLAGAGNDLVYGAKNIASTIYGGSGNDILFGGAKADFLYGENGDDVVDAGGINSSRESDFLNGGMGNDKLTNGGRNAKYIGGGGYDYWKYYNSDVYWNSEYTNPNQPTYVSTAIVAINSAPISPIYKNFRYVVSFPANSVWKPLNEYTNDLSFYKSRFTIMSKFIIP
mgnify:CR=1 FL=1